MLVVEAAPSPPESPSEKVLASHPPPFLMAFREGGGRFDLANLRFPGFCPIAPFGTAPDLSKGRPGGPRGPKFGRETNENYDFGIRSGVLITRPISPIIRIRLCF
jgi:hypothetical protein